MIKICEYCKKKLLDILNKLIIHNLMIINKRKKEPFYLLDRKYEKYLEFKKDTNKQPI